MSRLILPDRKRLVVDREVALPRRRFLKSAAVLALASTAPLKAATFIPYRSPPSGGKRYWRLYITAVNGDSNGMVNIAEIGLAESKGGTNIAGSATATSSSVFASDNPVYANDGSRTTFWSSANNSGPHWIEFDFGAGADKSIGEVRIVYRPSWVTRAPKDWKLQSSPDRSAWTDELTVTGETSWIDGMSNVYHTAGCPDGNSGSLFLKINLTTTAGGFAFGGVEAELRATVGGADFTNSRVAFYAPNSYGPQPLTALFDDNTSSIGGSNDTSGVYILMEFPTAQPVAQLMWKARSDSGLQNQAPAAGSVQECDTRNGTFSTVFSWSGSTGWSAGETRTFS